MDRCKTQYHVTGDESRRNEGALAAFAVVH